MSRRAVRGCPHDVERRGSPGQPRERLGRLVDEHPQPVQRPARRARAAASSGVSTGAYTRVEHHLTQTRAGWCRTVAPRRTSRAGWRSRSRRWRATASSTAANGTVVAPGARPAAASAASARRAATTTTRAPVSADRVDDGAGGPARPEHQDRRVGEIDAGVPDGVDEPGAVGGVADQVSVAHHHDVRHAERRRDRASARRRPEPPPPCGASSRCIQRRPGPEARRARHAPGRARRGTRRTPSRGRNAGVRGVVDRW